MASKINYFMDSGKRYFSDKSCPSCNSNDVKLVQRKYFVTRLFECQGCNLQFRHPKDSVAFNKEFYQEEYNQDGGITTTLPSQEELNKLLKNNFNNTDKSIAEFVAIFQLLFPDEKKLKVTDYGASWGYMSYQFLKNGYDVDSFEISRSRAGFGIKNLDLNIKTEESELDKGRDIFFSSHVIEHVPIVSNMIDLSKKLLSNSGFFVAICPNGSADHKKINETGFRGSWGKVHPNFLSDRFYAKAFESNPYIILSTPFDTKTMEQLSKWNQKDQTILDVSGPEILVIAKVNTSK